MTLIEVESDVELAAGLARRAGDLLLGIRAGGLTGQALKDEGDRVSHEMLASELSRLRPADVVRSEEAPDDARRGTASRVWIIDPLDGTREFSEPPREDWAVHVALWSDGDLVAGAVALPGLGMTLDSGSPPPLPPRAAGPMRMLVSRSRPPATALRVAEQVGAELVPMGSAGAKITAVVLGRADAYLHAGGQYEWDSAAPVAVARAAGLHASRVDGSPLVYNRPDPWQPDLLVCRPEVREVLMSALAGAGTDEHG